MDIKRLLNLNLFSPVKSVSRLNQVNQNDKSQDRDANGQEQYHQQNQEKKEMSDTEFSEAVKAFQELAVVKEHHWIVTTILENEKKYLLLKDNLGNLIRKIPDYDLWDIKNKTNDSNTKGTLLKRTA